MIWPRFILFSSRLACYDFFLFLVSPVCPLRALFPRVAYQQQLPYTPSALDREF